MTAKYRRPVVRRYYRAVQSHDETELARVSDRMTQIAREIEAQRVQLAEGQQSVDRFPGWLTPLLVTHSIAIVAIVLTNAGLSSLIERWLGPGYSAAVHRGSLLTDAVTYFGWQPIAMIAFLGLVGAGLYAGVIEVESSDASQPVRGD